MNKVVKEHIAVDRLPEELRHGFAAGEIVEVEVRSLGPSAEDGVPQASPPAQDDDGEEETITLESWLRAHWAEHGEPPPLPPEEVERRRAAFERIRSLAGRRNTTVEEAVRRIRELRDEDDA